MHHRFVIAGNISTFACGMAKYSRNTATVGFFDGVHRGHRYVLRRLVEDARAYGIGALVVTFRQHPRKVLRQDFIPKLLTPFEEKRRRMLQTGVDEVAGIDFTPEFASLTAREFMAMLHDEMGVRRLLIGYDNRFGRNREEGFDDYVAFGREIGIEVVGLKALEEEGPNVSSSMVRRLLANGDIEGANECLECSYGFEGTVVRGYGEGRKIGFPTANMQIEEEQLVPQRGVYAVRVEVDGFQEEFLGMMNIGCRPTYGEFAETVEVNILDFDADIYGRRMRVSFERRIRDERRFDSVEALKAQLALDKEEIRKIIAE